MKNWLIALGLGLSTIPVLANDGALWETDGAIERLAEPTTAQCDFLENFNGVFKPSFQIIRGSGRRDLEQFCASFCIESRSYRSCRISRFF